MAHLNYRLVIGAACLAASASLASAQFGAGPAWNVEGGRCGQYIKSARTGVFRGYAEARLSQFLWKVKLNNDAKQNHARSRRQLSFRDTSGTGVSVLTHFSAVHRTRRLRSIAISDASNGRITMTCRINLPGLQLAREE